MSLSWLFWWVYQLSPGAVVWIVLLCTLVFLWLLRLLEERRWWRSLLAAMLMVWLAAALWATILSRSGGTVREFQLTPFHSYREMLETGNREILRSNFMNVVLFYPAGLLLASLLPKRRRAAVTIALLAVFSLSIELVQYCWLLGRVEIDDVIHNTLGAVLGAAPILWEDHFSRISTK